MEHLSGFAPLAARYDGFVLDLWGVIHDGINAFPHAVDSLARLKEAGKRTLLLEKKGQKIQEFTGNFTQRLARQRLGLPGPRQHGPDAGHRYDLGQSFVGHGIELGGRDIDPAIRAPDTDDASLTQGGEELAEGRSD